MTHRGRVGDNSAREPLVRGRLSSAHPTVPSLCVVISRNASDACPACPACPEYSRGVLEGSELDGKRSPASPPRRQTEKKRGEVAPDSPRLTLGHLQLATTSPRL
jgi:hypothetical protein